MPFAKGLSYYKALDSYKENFYRNDFWVCVYNNNLDMAVLAWCYLYGKRNDDHCYERIADDPERFKKNLLSALKTSNGDWEKYRNHLLEYRDQCVAHYDKKLDTTVPCMEMALKSVCFYYEWVMSQVGGNPEYNFHPENLDVFFESCKNKAEKLMEEYLKESFYVNI